jgi:cytochrome c oxidase subunit 2
MKLVTVAMFTLATVLSAGAARGTPGSDTGARVYAASGCAGCHDSGVGPSLKGLFGRSESTDHGQVLADDAYVRESILLPGAKIVTGYADVMPSFRGQLTDDDLQALAAYVEEGRR